MKSKPYKMLLTGSLTFALICLVQGTMVSAEEASDKNQAPATKVPTDTRVTKESANSPRFMMRDDVGGHQFEPRSRNDAPTEADFTWNSLTGNGPASGMDPMVGNSRVASFYDFKDGQPHPYYIIKK